MRTIYIDSLNRCHITDDGTMTPVETDRFDGKCDTWVKGYCYEIKANETVIYPWKPLSELDKAQRDYEKQMLAEYAEALKVVGVDV